MGLAPGSRLGPYEIGDMLGSGGMGEVYRARDPRLNRTVAIKILPFAASDDPTRRERFEREARTIAGLHHPHICVLHDVGHQDGLDYLVMEHVDGEPLSDRLAKGPLPLAQVLHIGTQIAEALDTAHRAGIVHRDLKPANIILTGAGSSTQAKLLDFGLAKLTAPAVAAVASMLTQAEPAGRDLTDAGSIVGTTRYMAPEQLEGGHIDGRTDIFALGAVLYEMTTGRKAFDGKSQVSVVAAILEHQPTPISLLQPLTPPALEHVVATCLAKSPDDRWQTARDVAKQLKWIGSSTGAAAVATSPSIPARRAPWRTIGAVAGTIAAVAGVWAVATWFKPSEPAAQVMRFEVPAASVANPAFLTMLAVSPDGRLIAFIGQEAAGAPPALWLRPIDSVDARKVAGTEGALSPFWSPDSRHVAYVSLQGTLMRVDVAGGPPQTITALPGGPGPTSGTWRDDGTIVLGGTRPLMKVAASGGQPVAVTKLDAGAGELGHVWPVFLPDRRHVLFMTLSAGGIARHIKAVDIDNPTETVEVLSVNSSPIYSPSGHLLFHRDGTLMAQRFDVDRLSVSGEPVRIAEGLAYVSNSGRVAASVSSTGLLITREGAAFEPTRLVWFDRTGRRVGTIGDPALYRGVDVSPNGQLLAFHRHEEPSGGDIWVRDLQRETETRYTFDGHNFSPSWSRDGGYVMFTSDRDGGANLYRKAAGAARGDEMMLGSGAAAFVEDLTPDGEYLVYGAQTPSGLGIMRVPLNRKGDPEPVVDSPFFDGLSKVSPDGQWIAYESDDNGRREVFAQPFPKAATKVQISVDGGRYVRWSARGDELFYVKDDGSLMAASVTVKADSLVAGTPRMLLKADLMLSNHRGSNLDLPYDVTADGQRFVVNERIAQATPPSPIVVVVNWTSLLKQ